MGLDTSRILTDMFNDSTDYITLTAYNIEGNESGYSQELILIPGLPTPQEINDLTISRSDNNVVLSWSPVVSDTSGNPFIVSYYVILSSTESPPFEPTSLDSIGSVSPPATSFTDPDALDEQMRFYNVKSVIE